MNTAFVPLFPPYLDQGSEGAAVDEWGRMLIGLGYGEGIVLDAKYTRDGAIAQRTMNYQRDRGLTIDGNCGPEVRTDFKKLTGIDLDLIPAKPGEVTRWVGPDGKWGIWPVAEEPQHGGCV